MSDIQEVLNFDPLAAAEVLTGESYKDSNATASLGLMLHLQHGARKRAELGLRDDTHFGTPFADTLRIYQSEGFDVIYSETFPSSRDEADDTYSVLWRNGLLVAIESYGESTNSNKMSFNWRGDGWSLRCSGRTRDGVWVGDIDLREGTRHYLNRLANEGEVLASWIERPFLWLLNYSESQGDYDHKAITAAKIAKLPAEVQRAITPGGDAA